MIVARGYITLTNIQGSANLLDWQSQWKEGELPAGWSLNGVAEENSIIVHDNPFATKSVMWKCTPNAVVGTSSGDSAGGFYTPSCRLDNIHTYRYTTFVYREKASKGTIYHGCYNILNLDSAANGNPYFLANGLPAGQWYLLVGYIHPNKADLSWQMSSAGIYDMSGKKIFRGYDYKLQNPNIDVKFRDFLFYTDNPEDVAYFFNPRLEVCDGNEPSIEQLLQISTREEIDAVKVEYKSEIQKLDNKIAFSVSEVKTYADNKAASEALKAVDEIKIGTRNYIANKYLDVWVDKTAANKATDVDGDYYRIDPSKFHSIIAGGANKVDIFENKIAYKTSTQYTFSVLWKAEPSSNAMGIIIYFYYTDGTQAQVTSYSKDTQQIRVDYTTPNGKTLKMITGSYYSVVTSRIYKMQLTEGNKLVDFIKADEDIKADIDNIQVGGRNLYEKTTTIGKLDGNIRIEKEVDADSKNGFKLTGSQGSLGSVRLSNVIPGNGDYIISFWGKCNTAQSTLRFDICDRVCTGDSTFTQEWKRFELKATVSNFSTLYDFIDIADINWVYYWFKDFKVESGNKATDWTPAPEDVEADAQAKADAARVAAEAVAVAKANLAKTESQAYADGKVTAEERRAIADAQAKLNEAKADAQAKANAAQTAATAAAAVDATNKANNAQNNAITALTKDFQYPVGRYLVTDTKGLFLFATKIPEKRNNMTCVNFDGYMYGNQNAFGIKLVFYTYTSGLSSYGYIVTGADCVDRIRLAIKDGMVCIEMKFKQDVYYPGFIIDIAATMGNFPRSYSEGWTFSPDNIATGDLIDDTYTNVVVVPRKESFAETQSKAQFQILSDQIASKVSTESFNALGMRVSSAESTITQHSSQIASKVSQSTFDALGNRVSSAESTITQHSNQIATKVSQSTFDALGNRVTAAESSITQMPNKISLAVSTSEEKIKTSFTLDSTGISIIGKKIALTGVMTFSAFAPDAQSKVNNAQSTANTAVTKADAAQSTANSAVSKADTAQSGLNTLIGKLGDLSYEDMVGIAKLDTTIIEGGFIKTNLIDANAIITNSLLAEKIAATNITTSRLTVGTDCRIGKFRVYDNYLSLDDPQEGTIIRVGSSVLPSSSAIKSNIYIRDTAPALDKSLIVLNSSQPTGSYLDDARNYNKAIDIVNGTLRVSPGNLIDTPGLLVTGRVGENGYIQYQYGRKGRGRLSSTYAFGVTLDQYNGYKVIHDLGHTNYSVSVTPYRQMYEWNKIHAIILDISSDSFMVVFIDSGTNNRWERSGFCFEIYGENTL